MKFLDALINYLEMPAYELNTPEAIQLYIMDLEPDSPEVNIILGSLVLIQTCDRIIRTKSFKILRILGAELPIDKQPVKEAPFLSQEEKSAEEPKQAEKNFQPIHEIAPDIEEPPPKLQASRSSSSARKIGSL